MASFNFRRGLILLNMKKQMAISQKNAALSTSAKALGGHVDTKIYKDYNLHGGDVGVLAGSGVVCGQAERGERQIRTIITSNSSDNVIA